MADAPPQETVRFASAVTVKRAKASYGAPGVLALTDTTLVFLTANAKKGGNWVLQRSDITSVRKPWYGMGSYLTFEGKGQYFALAFGRRGPNPTAIMSGAAIRDGGVGLPIGLAGDALAVARMRQSAKLGNEWYARLKA